MTRLAFWLALLLPICSWSVLFTQFSPREQDFPLADDWSYARGFVDFTAGQGTHYFHRAAMPQLGQWLWAYPFSRLPLPLHTALRLSTLAASLLGFWGFYDLLRRRGAAASVAAFAAAALTTSPLFFLLSGTFMTDVPALSFALVALACYERGFAGQIWALLPAAMAAALAATTRQNMVAAPLAAMFFLGRSGRARTDPVAWLAVVVPAAAGVIAHVWLQSHSDAAKTPPALQPRLLMLLLPFVTLHWSGLAVLPFAALSPRPGRRRAFTVALLAMLATAGCWYYRRDLLAFGGLFPYVGGVFSPWGAYIGNLTPGALPEVFTRAIATAVTLLGCLGAAWLVGRFFESRRREPVGSLAVFTILQLPLLLVAPQLADRYFLALFPGIFQYVLPTAHHRPRWLPGLVVLLGMDAAAVALMHDCFAWNAARWQLGRQALGQGVDAWDIEGGFEWDGWFAPRGAPSRDRLGGPMGLALPFTQAYYPHVRGRYVLTFSELSHAITVSSCEYPLWMTAGRHWFLFQRYQDANDRK